MRESAVLDSRRSACRIATGIFTTTGHVLMLVDDESVLVERLESAWVAAGINRRPPVCVTVTARDGPDGAAYATTEMHLGALRQILCLVATAMGLSAYRRTPTARQSRCST